MLDWNIIAIALGAIISLLTFLYGILKPSKKDENKPDPHVEQALIKEQIKNIRSEVDTLKKTIQTSDEKTVKTLERFENRIEKLTDIIIEHLSKD